MSGIVGILHLNGASAKSADLHAAVQYLSHRGPDGNQIVINECVGLAHCKFYTTEESLHENLPTISSSGGVLITSDSRIDNRDELLNLLDIKKVESSMITDSDLIVAAYEKWGELCVERLIGDFAFAIWDFRKKLLFCARDCFGTKPFYYHINNNFFAFASEAGALFEISGIEKKLNEYRIAGYLADIVDNQTDTMFNDIYRLPAGEIITIDVNSNVKHSSYWKLDDVKELRLKNNQEYGEAFREVFRNSVVSRLRSYKPVAALLSGGIDSSSVCCVARDYLWNNRNKKLNVFSAIFKNNSELGETAYMQAVLEQQGFKENYIDVSNIETMFYPKHGGQHNDEPWDNPHSSLGAALLDRISEQNIRVVLDGNGGDSTVSYNFLHLAEYFKSMRWISLNREIRGLSNNFFAGQKTPFEVLNLIVMSPIKYRFKIRTKRLLGLQEKCRLYPHQKLIRNNFAVKHHLHDRIMAIRDAELAAMKSPRTYHAFEVRHDLITYGNEAGDRITSAYPIELRSPYHDKKLVEFCVSLPPEQRVYEGMTRYIVRQSLSDSLPEKVMKRGSKWTPNSVLRNRLTSSSTDYAREAINFAPEEFAHVICYKTLKEKYNNLYDDKVKFNPYTIWPATSFLLWLKANKLTQK